MSTPKNAVGDGNAVAGHGPGKMLVEAPAFPPPIAVATCDPGGGIMREVGGVGIKGVNSR